MSETAEISLNPQIRSPHNPRVLMAKNPFPLPPLPLGWDAITQILPHRYPFLLVDKITELEPGHRIVGLKNVTSTEEFFQGHFPGHPVMPGVLILESMAQVAGILILVTRNTPGALSYFASVEKAKWKKPVRPGDTVVTEAILDVLRGALAKVTVVGRVDGQVVVEGEYSFFTTTDSSAQTIVRVAGAAGAEAVSAPAPIEKPASNGHLNGSGAKISVHPTSIVDPKAILEEGVSVGPFCVIEGGTHIGAHTQIETNVIIKRGTSLGRHCRVMPNVVIGHEPQDAKFKGEESFVKIGDHNILREMVTIHRATGEGEATVIGHNNMLMAYVHLGHNCSVGDGNMISNSTGISGHVTIEDRCVIGGFVGIHQFVHIGKMAMVGGLSKIVQDVPPFCIADGRPGKIHGLNTRGLRRNGVLPEQRNQIGTAFKILFRSNLNTSQALEKVHAEVPSSEPLDYLTSFLERVREGRLGRQDETPQF